MWRPLDEPRVGSLRILKQDAGNACMNEGQRLESPVPMFPFLDFHGLVNNRWHVIACSWGMLNLHNIIFVCHFANHDAEKAVRCRIFMRFPSVQLAKVKIGTSTVQIMQDLDLKVELTC